MPEQTEHQPATAPDAAITFAHPEPSAPRMQVRPVFLPFAGCPAKCVYCAQDQVTGHREAPLESTFAQAEADLVRAHQTGAPAMELGFYGGTFTALPDGWPQRFLELAVRFRDKGVVSRIRCSTRPDAVPPPVLARLRDLGLDMVELGIQSFDDAALTASRRGYGRAQAQDACAAVRQSGLDLGVQLMPGLPGHSHPAFQDDVAQAVGSKASVARLYPCLVLDGTPLARMWARGDYVPWELDETVDALGNALQTFWDAGLPVIRMGLPPEPGLEAHVLAGPRHPALGQLARSRALFLHIRRMVQALPSAPKGLIIPHRFESDVLGHGKSMIPAYDAIGLSRGCISLQDSPTFTLLY